MKALTKLIYLCTVMCMAKSMYSQKSEVQWLTNYDDAVSQAKATDKFLIISFSGSDWCSNCKRLEKVFFDSEEFETYSDNFVLLKLDFPARKENQLEKSQRIHNERLADRYNPKGEFPKLIVLNSAEKNLGIMGYSGNDAQSYISTIDKMIQ